VPAFQRIREKQYQLATVAEPPQFARMAVHRRNEPGLGRPPSPSGYVAHVHLFINANIEKDGGAQNILDPGNGYKDQYKKIWGVM
jgi:ribose transport system substrate-binding protein